MTSASSTSASPPAVAAEGLRFAYPSRAALEGVSFRIAAGEIFGFLGPNGSGKTTLFKLLATLLPLQEGEVRLFGRRLSHDATALRRLFGVAFQSPSLDPKLSPAENLRFHGMLYGWAGQRLRLRIDGLLDRFHLGERRDERVAELSGGMQRRVEIAKALLPEPRLLLLDEPSSGLDPGARRELWATLDEVRRLDGVTVLLTTHFMEEADRCDRLALLHRGRIVAEGAPEALKEELGGDVVAITCDDPEQARRHLAARLDGEVDFVIEGSTLRFALPRAHRQVAGLVEAIPGEIEAVTVARPTLEDVFLHHTGEHLAEAGR